MNSSYCLNMSLCNNHGKNETNISFYNILLNACAKGTCYTKSQYCGTHLGGIGRDIPCPFYLVHSGPSEHLLVGLPGVPTSLLRLLVPLSMLLLMAYM